MLGNERTIFKDVDLCNHKLSTQIDFILVLQVEFKYSALHTKKYEERKKKNKLRWRIWGELDSKKDGNCVSFNWEVWGDKLLEKLCKVIYDVNILWLD